MFYIKPLISQWTETVHSVWRHAVGWNVRRSNTGEGEDIRNRPDRLWGPPSLLYVRYWVSFPGEKRRDFPLTTQHHLSRSLRKE